MAGKSKVYHPDFEARMNKPLFRKAVALLPNDHAKMLHLPNARAHLVDQRWREPVCNTCLKRHEDIKLKRCSCCGLVAYCSKRCQEEQWKAHKEYVTHLPRTPIPWPNDPMEPMPCIFEDGNGRTVHTVVLAHALKTMNETQRLKDELEKPAP